MPRDDFSLTVKRNLAIRAAHFCSNPHCMKLTAGPHSDEEKSLQTGHAAHVLAASKGGPRYDPKQTTQQRKAAKNGIWLCRECGVLVDHDAAQYPSALLFRWKKNHEELISEVRTAGYARSIELLRMNQTDKGIAKKLLDSMSDRRALWEDFDAEFPDRVRQSLDTLRNRLCDIKAELLDGSPMDTILNYLISTILKFFKHVENIDLSTLRCNSADAEWIEFCDALAALRKSVLIQLKKVSESFEIGISTDLRDCLPVDPP